MPSPRFSRPSRATSIGRVPPIPGPARPPPVVEDDLIERVAERVVQRLSDDVTGELVSEVVARVAERLVRDQIDRIKPV